MNLLQLGVGGNYVPKKHATNANGIEGLMPAELAKLCTCGRERGAAGEGWRKSILYVYCGNFNSTLPPPPPGG